MSIQEDFAKINKAFNVTNEDVIFYLENLVKQKKLFKVKKDSDNSIIALIDFYQKLSNSDNHVNNIFDKSYLNMRTLIPILINELEYEEENEKKVILTIVENYKLLHINLKGNFLYRLRLALKNSFKSPLNFDEKE